MIGIYQLLFFYVRFFTGSAPRRDANEGDLVSLSSNLIVNVFSIAILVIILIHVLKSTEKNLRQQKLFFLMLLVTLIMLIMDILSRFDGNPGTFYVPANHIGNFAIFLLNPVLPSLWLLYVYCQIKLDEGIRRGAYVLPAIIIINALMLILSQFFGWFYSIGSDNIYHRGPLFWIPVFLTAVLTVSAFVLVALNRKNIERKHFISLMLFPIPPLVCIIIQLTFYGISLILSGAALSILIAFITLQNDRINTDYLTKAYNRKGLELYIRQKINASTRHRTFSAILLDLDNFKSINDTLGHNTGDRVLATFVKLLRSCCSSHDFIARYGGDEFYIILDISNMEDLVAAAYEIKDCIESYNTHCKEPFELKVSMGYAVYDYHIHMNAEEFQKQVDALMYENKRVNKENQLKNRRLICQIV